MKQIQQDVLSGENTRLEKQDKIKITGSELLKV